MKLVIAGGGTGGHLFPGIAVAEEFLSRSSENEVLFIGTERGIESRAVPAAGYRLEIISAAGIRGKGSFGKLKGGIQMLYGYAQSRRVLREFQPDIVLGVGGYASLPVVMAARGLQIPNFIHEQNAIPGMSNRLLARLTDRAFITLEESIRYFPEQKVLLTGNPLRRQILGMQKSEAAEGAVDFLVPSPGSPFHIFVFGGSQGAHAINTAMVAALPFLKKQDTDLEITHQTGEKDCEEISAAYRAAGVAARVTPFISDMAAEYAKADLIVCRAGATTIAEVTACGKACLFIPFPHAVDDHQRRNAEALLKKEACLMLLEQELSGEKLAEVIVELIKDPKARLRMRQLAFSLARLDAAKIIVDEMTRECTA
ncbi:undecaprenyldiphospho-muramoylpentapeptide beta-N-acetylglucosaminyltransferase [Pelotalea chapellei]|uniref:UDP-N-acetylglucosamine--N-acetylmuramyl-(pentapeptide) pyrophosphoryl-undecaprenol N-acetylglucosamine transferase n=1 Tax=Pelotalea chapellei TaxID=44671 RepID=A0ABS5U8U6_9BACT|nr:undecaprenyldiphospho-muramoylpentapeptide beta-N-acetylglucosaminyltransferase [Pelotalea chapellei]MBT1072087.1 undecaprenyldiphospho-muramoylpentapeptide beta-N-acetylglucosaminyltransferase [Pelotalea chapellei]